MFANLPTNIIAFILVLGVLIFIHEAGHFLVAKLFKVRVLVFSFGFGKRLFGFQRGDTDYRVSLIPLGGYVRMAGDIPDDETPPAPDEFLGRPKWQRFLILFAGPAANILLAITFLTWLNMAGTEVLKENRPLLGAVLEGQPADQAGLKMGDLILEANGQKIETWDDLKLAISLHPDTPVELHFLRDGNEMTTTVVPEKRQTEYGISGIAGVQKYLDTEIGRVREGSAAEKAGLRPGDRIVEANGMPVTQLAELEGVFDKTRAKTIAVKVDRGGSVEELKLPPSEDGDLYRGVFPPTVTQKLPLVPAFRESLEQNWKMVTYAGIVISRMFKMQGSVKEFSGPISIARISGEMLRTGWKAVVFLMAGISLQLGIMNLLPIPVLDGGHIAILLVEGVARRDLSIQVKERIQQLGFAVLAALMLVVLYNDVIQNLLLLKNDF
jgi:regulator of sigma E protease